MAKFEGASPPPVRPKDFAAAGFEKQTPVRWFHPKELARAGVLALLSDLFGSFADKREIQAALNRASRETMRQYELEPGDRDFWFDYVADVGDGFDPTYSIAWLLAQETLTVRGEKTVTQRGRILFMGGDEVYPTAGREEYLNRTVGPYRAALPYLANEAAAPHLYALPGNHDWYDGLSAFLRQFAQKDRWIGAWRTQQTRSYFARKLPHGIWIWGIDIQLHADIDQPQLEYFDHAAKELEKGDRVILMTAEPSWVKEAEGDRAGYASLLHVMQKVTRAGANVGLVVTGDSHHYARYVTYSRDGGEEKNELTETHFVTAGGGGAFLHGTHTLPAKIRLPISTDAADKRTRELRRRAVFPRADESRALIRGNILSFPFKNWQFGAVWFAVWFCLAVLVWSDGADVGAARAFTTQIAGALSSEALDPILPRLALCGIALVFGVIVRRVFHTQHVERDATHSDSEPFEWRKLADVALWVVAGGSLIALTSAGERSLLGALLDVLPRNPIVALIVLLVPLASALYVSRPFEKTWGFVARLLFGLWHGTLYLTSWLLIASLFARIDTGPWLWVIGSAALSAMVSTWLFGGCLWFGGQYERALLNDAFSGIGIERFKNFLRFRIDSTGNVTVFSIGLRDIARQWDFKPARGDETSFIDPREPLEPHLIERIEIAAPATAKPVTKEPGNVEAPVDA